MKTVKNIKSAPDKDSSSPPFCCLAEWFRDCPSTIIYKTSPTPNWYWDGAGNGIRTRITSLEGWNNSHYTIPASYSTI